MEPPNPAIESDRDGGSLLAVIVQPGASRTGAVGLLDGRVKIAVAAPPVDGKANAELIKFLKKRLKVPAGAIALVSGDTGRRKRLKIDGVPPEELAQKLGL